MNYKTAISITAVILVIVAYIPYIRDVLKKKTTPHIFSFFIWGFSSFIIYALQVKGGAGVGAWVTLSVALFCSFIFILGLRNGDKDITKSDVVFLVLSLCSMFLWLFVDKPILANILIISVELLGFAPTFRKSWNKPYSETLFTYALCAIRHALAIFALQSFNILTLLNPIAWTIANGMFSVFLIIRRKQIIK